MKKSRYFYRYLWLIKIEILKFQYKNFNNIIEIIIQTKSNNNRIENNRIEFLKK